MEVASGREVWRHEALAKGVTRFFTSVSPLIVDDCAIVHLGGKDAGVLFAVEIATGQVRWRWAGEGPAYASPVVGTLGGVRQVILQTESTLTGIAVADGRRLWQVPTAPRSGYWNSVTPVVDGSVVYYSGQGTGTRAVQIERGDDGLQAREIWHNPDVGTVYNTPVLRDGFLFGLSPRGQFFCLEAATGSTRWVVNERVSNFGPIIDAGEVLVALPEKTGLVFFRPSAEKFDEVARHPVSDTPVYAHPVIAGDVIFVRDRDSVARWRLKSGEPGNRNETFSP
jgi:outer membrane protein assembly factor BamB